jgi:hypothetical protein
VGPEGGAEVSEVNVTVNDQNVVVVNPTEKLAREIETLRTSPNRLGSPVDAFMDGVGQAAQIVRRGPEYHPHPGENHTFDVACTTCGLPGMVNLSIITPDEVVRIGPITPIPTAED